MLVLLLQVWEIGAEGNPGTSLAILPFSTFQGIMFVLYVMSRVFNYTWGGDREKYVTSTFPKQPFVGLISQMAEALAMETVVLKLSSAAQKLWIQSVKSRRLSFAESPSLFLYAERAQQTCSFHLGACTWLVNFAIQIFSQQTMHYFSWVQWGMSVIPTGGLLETEEGWLQVRGQPQELLKTLFQNKTKRLGM